MLVSHYVGGGNWTQAPGASALNHWAVFPNSTFIYIWGKKIKANHGCLDLKNQNSNFFIELQLGCCEIMVHLDFIKFRLTLKEKESEVVKNTEEKDSMSLSP